MSDIKTLAAEKAVNTGGEIIYLVVAAAVALAVIGGTLIEFLQVLPGI